MTLMKRTFKRFLSLLLVMLTLVSVVSVAASAVSIPSVSTSKYITCYSQKENDEDGKLWAYSDSALTTKTGGYISIATDECKIVAFSSDGRAVRIKYPTSTSTKTAWFYRKDFVARDVVTNGAIRAETAAQSITAYKYASTSRGKLGTISKGDKVYVVGGSYTSTWSQVIYPVDSNGTYKMGWIKTSALPISSTKVALSSSSASLTVGGTKTLTATLTPSNSTDSITWKSSNTSVATVSSSGKISAIAAGTAKITATATSGKSATCTVTVTAGSSATTETVKLSPTSTTIVVGKTATLKATVTGGSVSAWSSSNTSVATVDSTGKVTAKKAGTAKITVTTSGGKTASCTVKVVNITVYKQKDSRWSSYAYGYSNTAGTKKATIGSAGCGLLSLTNAVYYLNGTFISPKTIADYSLKNGYRINGVGTAFGLYKSFADSQGSKYGIKYVHYTSSWATLRSDLNKGYVAICSKSGHIMTIVDYDANTGKYLLLDSYPSSNRGTSKTGYIWATYSYLKNTVGLRNSFYVLKSTK